MAKIKQYSPSAARLPEHGGRAVRRLVEPEPMKPTPFRSARVPFIPLAGAPAGAAAALSAPYRAAEGLGQVLQQIGARLDDVFQNLGLTEAKTATHKAGRAKVGRYEGLVEADAARYQDWPTEYARSMSEVLEENSRGLRPEARAALEDTYARVLSRGLAEVQGLALAKGRRQARNGLMAGLGDLERVAESGRGGLFEEMIREGQDLVNRAVSSGAVTEEQGRELVRTFGQRLGELQVRLDFRADPDGTVRRLEKGGYKEIVDPARTGDLLQWATVAREERKRRAADLFGGLSGPAENELRAVRETGQGLGRDVAVYLSQGEDLGVLAAGTARQHQERIEAARLFHRVTSLKKTRPFAERRKLARELALASGDGRGRTAAHKLYSRVEELLDGDERKFQRDPVGYLQPVIQTDLESIIGQGLVDRASESAVVRASLDLGISLQSRLDDQRPPRVLSARQAGLIGAAFARENAAGRMRRIVEGRRLFGRYWPQVMAEAGVESAVLFAAGLAEDPRSRPLAVKALEVCDKSSSDFSSPAPVREEVRLAVERGFEETDLGRVLDGLIRVFPQDAGLAEYRQGVRSVLGKAALDEAERGLLSPADAAETALSDFDRENRSIVDEKLAVVLVPREWDLDLVRAGLFEVRARLLSGGGTDGSSDSPAPARNGEPGRAIWINEGPGVALMDLEVRRVVKDEKGRPARFAWEDIETEGVRAAGKSPSRPWPCIPGGRLFWAAGSGPLSA